MTDQHNPAAVDAAAADAGELSRPDALEAMRQAARHVTHETLHPSDIARLAVATAAAVECLAARGLVQAVPLPAAEPEQLELEREHSPAYALRSLVEIAEAQLALGTRQMAAQERIAGALEQLVARAS